MGKKEKVIYVREGFSRAENKQYPGMAIPIDMLRKHEGQLMCNSFYSIESYAGNREDYGLSPEFALAVLEDRRSRTIGCLPDWSVMIKRLNEMVSAWKKNYTTKTAKKKTVKQKK